MADSAMSKILKGKAPKIKTKKPRKKGGKITKGDITSGEYIRDQKEIYEFPVGKPPKDMDKRKFFPVDKLPKEGKQPRGGFQAPGPRKPADKKIKQKGLTSKQMTLPKQLQRKIIESKKSGAGYSGSYS